MFVPLHKCIWFDSYKSNFLSRNIAEVDDFFDVFRPKINVSRIFLSWWYLNSSKFPKNQCLNFWNWPTNNKVMPLVFLAIILNLQALENKYLLHVLLIDWNSINRLWAMNSHVFFNLFYKHSFWNLGEHFQNALNSMIDRDS